ncbi:netrin receptor DCC [Lucilia sericata]|uniref:netrin receptor DCC n=1 Tax=Lucilia sericata TaxID=13632 RepID=UPI0018A80007|nr:netrin receptor DCC [Lucilia sericata]
MPLTNFNNYNKQYYYGSSYIEDEDNKTTTAATLKQLPPKATISTKAPATSISHTFAKMPAKYANATFTATHTKPISETATTIIPTKSSSLLLTSSATTTKSLEVIAASSSFLGVAVTSLPLSSSFASTSACSLSGAAAVYPQMKKYCRRFLFVISLVCLLHSCLLWNTAEAAISNRATNSRPLSNAPQSSLSGPQPRFLSRGHTYRAVVGDTLVLPCQVENLGTFVLLWRRGINVLTASNIMVTRDERIRLIDGYNLEISDLEPQDAGDYVCQISDKINRDQVHTVEILVPPSVRATPTSGNLQARKGGPVTLECKGSGNPVPSIYWTKKSGAGKSTARIGDGPILTLEKVERQQAGVYQCTADNGVGEPVSVDIRLDVLYPPDIQVEKSWIHSGEGFEAKLVCIVYADPIATVSWYQNSFLIQTTDRRIMSSRGNRHTLTIRHIQQEDFGNYSCVADNTLGRSRKYMELSGRPGPAEFYSPKWGRSSDSYNLTWKIDSYPPLEEVRLLYRRVLMNDTFQHPGRWHDFILTPEHRPASEPLTHIMSYTIKNLVPGAYYEAIVQAKNRYGWNEVSDIFQFIVASNSMDIPPEESEVVASSKSRSNAASSSALHTYTLKHLQLILYAFVATSLFSSLCQKRRQFWGLGQENSLEV